jgi:hypothetical protein
MTCPCLKHGFLCFSFVYLFVWDKALLCSPCWPQAHNLAASSWNYKHAPPHLTFICFTRIPECHPWLQDPRHLSPTCQLSVTSCVSTTSFSFPLRTPTSVSPSLLPFLLPQRLALGLPSEWHLPPPAPCLTQSYSDFISSGIVFSTKLTLSRPSSVHYRNKNSSFRGLLSVVKHTPLM